MNRSVPVATHRGDITEFLLLARGQQPALLVDAKLRDFVSWWLRMHRHRNALRMVRLKAVTGGDSDSATPQRFVFEVCKWPRHRRFEWMFICWMIDGVGMWSRTFPTRREALAFFSLPPHEVLHKPSSDASEPNQ